MKKVDAIAMTLLIIGGLSWGIFGAFDFDFVEAIFGPGSFLSRTIYILFGLSAIYEIILCMKGKKRRK